MKISIIAAMDESRGIGKDNKIPWHIKEDLVHLKNLTLDHAVILGRTSYDSMVGYYSKSGREMPGKIYIVLTRDNSYRPEGKAVVASSIEKAIEIAKEQDSEESFVIGGAKIFEQFLPLADRLYLTIVEGKYDADTFFPDYSKFKTVLSERKSKDDNYVYNFVDLGR